MIQWYLSVKNLIRSLEEKSRDALPLYEEGGKAASAAINSYMRSDYEQLWDIWEQKFPNESLGNLGRHIHFGMNNDYHDIINHDLPSIEKKAEAHLKNSLDEEQPMEHIGFEELLHPVISANAYQLYRNGHLRESVFNSITAVFDLIRERTGIEEDGDRLIGKAMSIDDPKIILSELETESGKNDQKGFMQI